LSVGFPVRLLRKNHSGGIPSRVLFIDTETEHGTNAEGIQCHTVKLGWSCYCSRPSGSAWSEKWLLWRSGYSLCRYMATLARKKQPVTVFAHNIGFDLQASGFYKHMAHWGWKLTFIYEKGLTFLLIIHKGERTIKLVSTTNFYDAGVKDLGDLIKLPKLDVDLEAGTEVDVIRYCRRDVEIIKTFMLDYFSWIRDNDLGRFRLTRGSQAFNAFRHRFMDKRIYVHDIEKVKELEREAYMGGRVECFRIGGIPGGPFVHLDVNSLYPWIMTQIELPVKLVDYRENVPVDELFVDLRHFCVVADVTLSTDWPWYALRRDLKIIFPTGKFRTLLTTPDLVAAPGGPHIHEVHRLAVYTKAKVFVSFVDYFYNLRLRYKRDGDRVREIYTKKLMNSLYGKFGQREPVETITEDVEDDLYWRSETLDPISGETDIEYVLMNTRVLQMGWKEGRYSSPAIAAHITAAGRRHLAEILHKLPPQAALYCDTDSISIPERVLPLLADKIDPEA